MRLLWESLISLLTNPGKRSQKPESWHRLKWFISRNFLYLLERHTVLPSFLIYRSGWRKQNTYAQYLALHMRWRYIFHATCKSISHMYCNFIGSSWDISHLRVIGKNSAGLLLVVNQPGDSILPHFLQHSPPSRHRHVFLCLRASRSDASRIHTSHPISILTALDLLCICIM